MTNKKLKIKNQIREIKNEKWKNEKMKKWKNEKQKTKNKKQKIIGTSVSFVIKYFKHYTE